jgi:hypothetical protein
VRVAPSVSEPLFCTTIGWLSDDPVIAIAVATRARAVAELLSAFIHRPVAAL